MANLDIDYNACLLKGLIGGIGAMPGTCGSHPFDVLKIRMQVNGEKLGEAVKNVHYGTNSNAHSNPAAGGAGGSNSKILMGNPSLKNFYRGFLPAIEQRLITRGPMFLFSELYTQTVYQNTSLSKTQATYVGSCGSGFTTGFLAGIAEYRKKLLSQNIITPQEARWDRLFSSAKANGTLPFLFRRLLAAGTCSATYDSVFFGTEVFLQQQQGFNPGMSYGCAAVAAVVAAFAFDSAVARMMVVPPSKACLTFPGTLKDLFKNDPMNGIVGLGRVVKGYRGLSARSVEFFINYSITGMTSVYVIMVFNRFFLKKEDSETKSTVKET